MKPDLFGVDEKVGVFIPAVIAHIGVGVLTVLRQECSEQGNCLAGGCGALERQTQQIHTEQTFLATFRQRQREPCASLPMKSPFSFAPISEPQIQ